MVKFFKSLYAVISVVMVVLLIAAYCRDRFDLIIEYKALFYTLFFLWWGLLYFLFIRKRR